MLQNGLPGETLEFLKEQQIGAHILATPQAVELYSQFAKDQAVGGLFHTTC